MYAMQLAWNRFLHGLVVLMVLATASTVQATPEAETDASPNEPANTTPGFSLPVDGPISQGEIVAAQQFGQNLSIAEWLGPLAPVALSPFFGITCLSGMSLYGGGWISATNPMIGEHSPLHNSAVFWTFLTLTVITSVPRLTQVSKPFAQAVDQLEAWSGIVTMLVLKLMISSQTDAAAEMPSAVQAGVFSFSTDALLIIAGSANILVINTVKFFFEVLVWLTPFPLLDAAFEIANKAVCAGLMAIYAYSPVLATGVNLLLFLVCGLIFAWIRRRELFFRTMLIDALKAVWSQPEPGASLIVFPCSTVGCIPARSRCVLTFDTAGWKLSCRRLTGSVLTEQFSLTSEAPELQRGIFTNSIVFREPACQLIFSRRFNSHLPKIVSSLRLRESESSAALPATGSLQAEFR
jgi:hypothetical protein